MNNDNKLLNEKYMNVLCEFVCEGQKAMKKFYNSESAVSLRDVNRVKEVFLFYLELLQYKEKYGKKYKETFEHFRNTNVVNVLKLNTKTFLTALSVSMHLNYLFRLGLTGKLIFILWFFCFVLI
jgi:hypothetical protein